MSNMAVFAIDFDGTIVKDDYPNIGEPILDAITAMKEIKRQGHKIIIWSCRVEPQLSEMRTFLVSNNIPFDYINENCPIKIAHYNNDTRKIGADYYIDDKMVGHWTWGDVITIAIDQADKKN
jgi:hydroxymethylpyrimidine pyrophosphatase-like HAD family hydrolase